MRQTTKSTPISKKTSDYEDAMTLFFRDIAPYKVMDPEEQKSILLDIRKGNTERKDELILSNMKLVVSIARKYNTYLSETWEILDLIQEGAIGLIHAIDVFDISKVDEINLSTYATFWIKQAMGRFMDNVNYDIRVPVHMLEKYRRMKKLMRESGLSEKEAMAATDLSKRSYLDVTAAINLDSLNRVISMDDHDSNEIGDLIPDFSTDVENSVVDGNTLEEFIALLDTLPERTAMILRRRIGIDGPPETLEEIAKDLGCTRERVRQIEKKGKDKIRKKTARLLCVEGIYA